MNGNESRRTGILRLKHLREKTEARAEELAAQAPRFERLADPAAAPQVVSAFGLFPTPFDLARRVVQLAGVAPGLEVLEPSAGMGDLAHAAKDAGGRVWCVEIDDAMSRMIWQNNAFEGIKTADFLALTPEGIRGRDRPLFDRVVMNPPFAPRAADVQHVRHAMTFLKPGGRLVSVVMNGPRQRAALQPIAAEWVDLPAGSFRSVGTSVDTALFVYDAPA